MPDMYMMMVPAHRHPERTQMAGSWPQPGVLDAAFEETFRAHYADLYRYALRRCPTSDDAEDLVAETFTIAWRRRHDLPGGNETRLWLFGTARRVLLNDHRAHRRRRRLVTKVQATFGGAQGTPADAAIEQLPDERLRQALLSLNSNDREVLAMVAWDGLSASEIASIIDTTPAAARKRVERARTRFRDVYDGPLPTGTCYLAREEG